MNKLGKWKTATQMTALTILLVARDPRWLQCALCFLSRTTGINIYSLTHLFIFTFGVLCSLQDKVVLVGSGVLLLYISAGLAVWSLVVYMKKIWKILLK